MARLTVQARHEQLLAVTHELDTLQIALDTITLADIRRGNVQRFVELSLGLERARQAIAELAGTNVAIPSSS